MKQQMKNSDTHIHVDQIFARYKTREEQKEALKKYLDKAEKEGLEMVSFVQFDRFDTIELLEELNESGELSKHFSGKVVFGVELNSVLDADHTNEDGSNYDGYNIHLLCYMTLDDAKKLRDALKRDKEKDYEQDYMAIIERIKFAADQKGIKVEFPSVDDLKEGNTPHIVKDLHAWIFKDPERAEIYRKVLNIDESFASNGSKFIRLLAQTPGGVLYYQPAAIPSNSNLLKTVKTTTNAKIIIPHPADMSADFKTEFYLDSLLEMPKQVEGTKNFDGIETIYYKNTIEENKISDAYAEKYGLLKTAGSDSFTIDEGPIMWFNKTKTGEIYFVETSFGGSIGNAYDLGNYTLKEVDGKKIMTITEKAPLVAEKDLFDDLAISFSKENKKNLDDFSF